MVKAILVVAEKFINAQNVGLIPVLCVGETLEEREAGRTLERIVNQLEFIVKAAGIDAFANAVVAYEPVWAIGTGRTASPEQAQMVHAYIREWFSRLDKEISANLCLLYGGSVKASNANGLFVMDDIDGALVGGGIVRCRGVFKNYWCGEVAYVGTIDTCYSCSGGGCHYCTYLDTAWKGCGYGSFFWFRRIPNCTGGTRWW